MIKRKPRIGLLGLMTDGYEVTFPGIVARQEAYAKEIVNTLSPVTDVDFPGAGLNRKRIEEIVKYFNEKEYDGILIILLAYSQGSYLLRALQNNRLPIALAVVQPDQEVKDDFEELDLTVNQGIHGAQDNSNVINRAGIPCQFFAGNRKEKGFLDFVEDFSRAAMTYTELRKSKVAVIGRMQGMGDILTDDMAFYRKIGVEICHDTIGSVVQRMEKVTDNDIEQEIKEDYKRFQVDPKLTHESHSIAVREYLAFKHYLEENGYNAFTAHFDVFGDDLRWRQLPLYAASRLMADGYGYAAEGDLMCASMVYAAHLLGDGGGNFTEMYMMDFVKKAIIFCHAGEGNWATHREDMQPRLIDRYLGEGGLENPPTIMFTPKVGRSTLTSLVAVAGDKFRMVAAVGDILPKSDLKRCEMPYIFWRPDCGIENCVTEWLKNGGTHHEVISLGSIPKRWKMLCNMWGVEFVEI